MITRKCGAALAAGESEFETNESQPTIDAVSRLYYCLEARR